MGPSPHLLFCACKTTTLGPDIQVCMGPRPQLWFCASKTACLVPDLLVSIGPSPHLWFFIVKQKRLDQNFKSLWPQTSPVVLCMQNSVISTSNTVVWEILVLKNFCMTIFSRVKFSFSGPSTKIYHRGNLSCTKTRWTSTEELCVFMAITFLVKSGRQLLDKLASLKNRELLAATPWWPNSARTLALYRVEMCWL